MVTREHEAIVVMVAAPADAAEGIAQALVESRLAACVNVMPGVTSYYRWEGEVQRDAEVLLLVKTLTSRFEAVAALVQEMHPYDLPEVIALPVDLGSSAYLDWIEASVADA